jgi:hypothetical protein
VLGGQDGGGMTLPPARSRAERLRDTRARLHDDVDCWVATADEHGPHLVPLSFLWDGSALWLATAAASRTARNLAATGRVRLGLGPTRDVVLIDGEPEVVRRDDLAAELGNAFAAATGFDPRDLDEVYVYLRVVPLRILAWREVNELQGRVLMRDGQWLDVRGGA